MDTDIGAMMVIFTEFYYWVTVPLMFLIHVGFCMYEVGATRRIRTMMHTLMKNTMLIPLVTVTFFFFGWWIYFAFPQWSRYLYRRKPGNRLWLVECHGQCGALARADGRPIWVDPGVN